MYRTILILAEVLFFGCGSPCLQQSANSVPASKTYLVTKSTYETSTDDVSIHKVVKDTESNISNFVRHNCSPEGVPARTFPKKAILKSEDAANMVKWYLNKCCLNTVEQPYYDELNTLVAYHNSDTLEWWSNLQGNGVDGIDEISLTIVDTKNCKVKDSLFAFMATQSIYTPIWSNKLDQNTLPETRPVERVIQLFKQSSKFGNIEIGSIDSASFRASRMAITPQNTDPQSTKVATGKQRCWLFRDLYPEQAFFDGSPTGSPTAFFSKSSISRFNSELLKSLEDRFQNKSEVVGVIVSKIDEPRQRWESGRFRTFTTSLNERFTKTLIASVNTEDKESCWVGFVEGPILWHDSYENFTFGSLKSSRLGFSEDPTIVIVDNEKCKMHHLKIDLQCPTKDIDENMRLPKDSDCEIVRLKVKESELLIFPKKGKLVRLKLKELDL